MPDSWTPSRRLQAAALAERDRIERDLAKLDADHDQAIAHLRRLEAAQQDLQEQLAMLDRLAHRGTAAKPVRGKGISPRTPDAEQTPTDLSPSADATPLRGARIREAAVRILVTSSYRERPIHYRQWYELFLSHGLVPAGANPLPTFLVQLGRSPVVRRTTHPGIYELDLEFPERARRQLAQLREALAHLHTGKAQSGLSNLVASRKRRATLTAEIDQLERALEEALRSLGDETETSPLSAQAV